MDNKINIPTDVEELNKMLNDLEECNYKFTDPKTETDKNKKYYYNERE